MFQTVNVATLIVVIIGVGYAFQTAFIGSPVAASELFAVV